MSSWPIASSARGTRASVSARVGEIAGEHMHALAEIGGKLVEASRLVPESATVAP